MVHVQKCSVPVPFDNTSILPEVWEEESPREFDEIQCSH